MREADKLPTCRRQLNTSRAITQQDRSRRLFKEKINRRSFIAQSTMGMGALALSQWPLAAEADDAKNKQPLGFQTYPFREAISKDFSGTLKKVAAMGYQVVEMCYPSGYAKAGFGNLVNVKASEILRIIKDAGLS